MKNIKIFNATVVVEKEDWSAAWKLYSGVTCQDILELDDYKSS